MGDDEVLVDVHFCTKTEPINVQSSLCQLVECVLVVFEKTLVELLVVLVLSLESFHSPGWLLGGAQCSAKKFRRNAKMQHSSCETSMAA